MSTVLNLLNSALGTAFDILLLPFRSLPPMIGLLVVSVLCSIGMLLGYRATSNQPAIELVKRKITAGLFEIRLYNDDVRAILAAQGAILKHNLRYLVLNMVPMVFMMVPFVLVVAQLQFHYGYEGFGVGEPILVQARITEGASDDLQLSLPDGLRLDAPRVRMPALPGAAWKVVAERPGTYEVTLRGAGTEATKSIQVGDRIERRSPFRLLPGFVNQLMYPAEPPLPADGPITEISVLYPERAIGVLGFDLHWLIWFFALTIVLAFAMKGMFGVTI